MELPLIQIWYKNKFYLEATQDVPTNWNLKVLINPWNNDRSGFCSLIENFAQMANKKPHILQKILFIQLKYPERWFQLEVDQ